MKSKYYRLKDSLQAHEAIEYLESLTGVRLSANEMLEVLESQEASCYIDILAIPIDAHIIQSDDWLKAAVMPTGLQKFLGGVDEKPYRHIKVSTQLEQVHFLISPDAAGSSAWLLERRYPFFNQFFLKGDVKAVERGEADKEVEMVAPTAFFATLNNYKISEHDINKHRREFYLFEIDCVERGVRYTDSYWSIERSFFSPEWEEIALEALFKPTDIEALAAKMNNEPDHEALQEENQRLQQEIEALKAEMERLEAENAQLKAADEINPRKEDTYLHMIAAMALKLGHDFSASQNGTNTKIRKKLFEIHGKEMLSESVVRNSLNKAQEVLPEALIRPKSK